ncbi:MAG: alpha/beta hydrolase-fold protein, partial [Acidimicrobiia bacterium]|nr:alpha/beta hydrolase-fold protein [Acidimicrobiia bacterium]
LLSGRAQPYGTVMVEHQGEVVQPPVDPTVTDEQRQALGVPPLHELEDQVRRAGRVIAQERAAQDGYLPPGQRFCRVWTDPNPAELRARWAAEGAKAWADGDVLTFVTESPVPVAVTPVFPIPSWDAGDGLQVLSMRVERLEEAVITYTFRPLGGSEPMSFSRGSHDGRFRGPASPPEAPSNDPLVGSTFEHAVESATFGEPRTVTVYRPPDHTAGEAIPVVYATDGNMFAPYARRLDAAIEAEMCPRVIVVAAHAAPADQIRGNQRALEYLIGFDDHRFDAHQRFFVDELTQWAEVELGVSGDRSLRGVFGCSDGGGHALSTGRLHPDKFGHVFAFSTGMPPELSMAWDSATHPFVHLCAGTLEGAFHQATEAWAGYLHHQGAAHHFTERVAGHDLIQWCEELPNAIANAWA